MLKKLLFIILLCAVLLCIVNTALEKSYFKYSIVKLRVAPMCKYSGMYIFFEDITDVNMKSLGEYSSRPVMVYSTLQKNEKGFYTVRQASIKKPKGKELYIKGKSYEFNKTSEGMGCFRVQYGIEDFYKKNDYNADVKKKSEKGYTLVVKINSRGNAKVIGIEDYIADIKENVKNKIYCSW